MSDSSPAAPQKKIRSTAVRHEPYPLVDMNCDGVILVYFAAEDGKAFPEAADLLPKFQLEQVFRTAKKEAGNVIRTENWPRNCILNGFVVKKTLKDRFDFVLLESCVKTLQKQNRKDKLSFVGFEAFKDVKDQDIMSKIVNIFMNSLSQVDIYVCWPKDLHHLMPPKF